MTTTKIACCWGVMGCEGRGDLLNCPGDEIVSPSPSWQVSCLVVSCVLTCGWKDQPPPTTSDEVRRMNYLAGVSELLGFPQPANAYYLI
jgi:hypothetical protein